MGEGPWRRPGLWALPPHGEAWSCPLFSTFTCPGPAAETTPALALWRSPADPAARSGGSLPRGRHARGCPGGDGRQGPSSARDGPGALLLSPAGPRLGWLQSWHQILPGPGEAPRPVPFRLGCSAKCPGIYSNSSASLLTHWLTRSPGPFAEKWGMVLAQLPA